MTAPAVAVRERPILMSGPMVQAILDGSKTQTRRVAKVPHSNPLGVWEPAVFGGLAGGRTRNGEEVAEFPALVHTRTGHAIACPFEVGQRLWVRERWQFADWTDDGHPFVRYAADNTVRLCEGAGKGESLVDTWAELSDPANYAIDQKAADRRWRPSIFMPRWASRLLLEITAVRIERIQDISESDARAGGVERHDDDGVTYYGPWLKGHASAVFEYRRVWDSLNAKRGHGWDTNPWVWCITFRKVQP